MTRVLVIGGAYGMIGGAEVARDLSGQGVAVTALGRNPMTARKVLPDAAWVFQDLRDLTRPEDWTALIAGGHSHVINCAGGALQDNARDDLSAVHDASIAALATACAEAKVGLIQISAVGGAEASAPPTEFMGGSKARGDAAVRAAGGDWWIYRPGGLVLARTGYGGGTALMRLLAAVPLVQPITFAGARMQTVGGMQDICAVIRRTLAGDIPPRCEADLVEDAAHSLEEIVAVYRQWLGFPPPPDGPCACPAGQPVRSAGWRTGWGGGWAGAPPPAHDGAGCDRRRGGHGGGCTPDPSTVGKVRDAVASDPGTGPGTGRRSAFCAYGPAYAGGDRRVVTVLDHLRLIGAARVTQAAATLADWPAWLARTSVLAWAVVDVALGAAVLYRPWAKQALWAMVAVCGIYVLSASVFTPPALWLDPLGPLVKILPAALLALVALPMIENR